MNKYIKEFRENFCYEEDNTLELKGLRRTGMTDEDYAKKIEDFILKVILKVESESYQAGMEDERFNHMVEDDLKLQDE